MAEKIKWKPGSFFDNLDAAARYVGYDNLPLAFGLARINWPSVDERDTFLRALTRINDEGNPGAASPV